MLSPCRTLLVRVRYGKIPPERKNSYGVGCGIDVSVPINFVAGTQSENSFWISIVTKQVCPLNSMEVATDFLISVSMMRNVLSFSLHWASKNFVSGMRYYAETKSQFATRFSASCKFVRHTLCRIIPGLIFQEILKVNRENGITLSPQERERRRRSRESRPFPPLLGGGGRGQGECASNFFFDLALHRTSYVYERNGENRECQPPSPWPSPPGEGTAAAELRPAALPPQWRGNWSTPDRLC